MSTETPKRRGQGKKNLPKPPEPERTIIIPDTPRKLTFDEYVKLYPDYHIEQRTIVRPDGSTRNFVVFIRRKNGTLIPPPYKPRKQHDRKDHHNRKIT